MGERHNDPRTHEATQNASQAVTRCRHCHLFSFEIHTTTPSPVVPNRSQPILTRRLPVRAHDCDDCSMRRDSPIPRFSLLLVAGPVHRRQPMAARDCAAESHARDCGGCGWHQDVRNALCVRETVPTPQRSFLLNVHQPIGPNLDPVLPCQPEQNRTLLHLTLEHNHVSHQLSDFQACASVPQVSDDRRHALHA